MKARTHRISVSLGLSITLALAGFAMAGCESEQSNMPGAQSVPASPPSETPSAAPQTATGGEEAPTGLPANHPPIPGAQGQMPAGLPAGHPPIPGGGSPMAGAPFMGGPAMDAGGLTWQAPSSWQEEPPASSMRLTQWRVGGSQPSGPAECALLRFQGGGTVEDNLDRWVSQFTQPDGSNSADHAQTFRAEVHGLAVTRLELTGTFASSMGPMGPMAGGQATELPNYGLFAAVIEAPQGMYFLKCTGPEATMAAERPGMLSLVESMSL